MVCAAVSVLISIGCLQTHAGASRKVGLPQSTELMWKPANKIRGCAVPDGTASHADVC